MFTLLCTRQHCVLILKQALNVPAYLYGTACNDAYLCPWKSRGLLVQWSLALINLIARFVRPRPVIFAEHNSASYRCALESPAQLFMPSFCVRPEITAVPIFAALFVSSVFYFCRCKNFVFSNSSSLVQHSRKKIPSSFKHLLKMYVISLLAYTRDLFFWSAIIYEPYWYIIKFYVEIEF